MSKAMPVADEPSIESLLDSIRRAIHDEYTAAAPEASAPAGAPAPRTGVRRSSVAQQPPTGPAAAALKRRPSPAPHLRAGPQDNPRAPSSTSRPLIAPLAPQLEGSLRDLKVNIQPAATSGPAQASPSEELRALRSRIADLSATRARLARIASGGPSSFASVLGGATKPDQAVRNPRTFMPAPPPPPPANALRGGVAGPDQVSWEARPVAAAPVPPLDLPPLERTAAAPHAAAFGSDESYIEQPLPDPGASDYAADAWDRIEEGEPEAEHAIPALPAATDHQRAMLSQEVAEATATAFDRLADTIVSQASGGARSIEDITRDLLRPMLKAWLDANLQGVVERLVREEIDRVSRRSGR